MTSAQVGQSPAGRPVTGVAGVTHCGAWTPVDHATYNTGRLVCGLPPSHPLPHKSLWSGWCWGDGYGPRREVVDS